MSLTSGDEENASEKIASTFDFPLGMDLLRR